MSSKVVDRVGPVRLDPIIETEAPGERTGCREAALTTDWIASLGPAVPYEEVKARHILVRFKDSKVPLRDGQKELSDAEALVKAQELKKKLKGLGYIS